MGPLSLCSPDKDKSCFACCPPIRPAGYEHIQYKNFIKRVLRENSRNFNRKERSIVPVTGFSCWALGYADKDCKLPGCLLHPAGNKGSDLRYRIDYGDKCSREACLEEKVFRQLDNEDRRFWLNLADGLDSFEYSSRKFNPIFRLMEWGISILNLIRENEGGNVLDRDVFFRSYPFFKTELSPRGNAYLINELVNKKGISVLTIESFRKDFENFSFSVSEAIMHRYGGSSDGPHTHLIEIDRGFSDFLRLSVRIFRIDQNDALDIKAILDEEILKFSRKINY